MKVREVGIEEEKSVQEIEQALLDKHEESLRDEPKVQVEEQTVDEAPKLGDEDILSYIKERYNKDITSVDDLFREKESNEELPEDVSAFLKYKKETGRGIGDFVKLNEDYDSKNEDELIANYYAATEAELDSEDIDYLLSDKFSYDEELDDDSEIKQKKIAKKKELAKAKKYFNELKETYKIPVESKGGLVSDDEKESYNAYKDYIKQSQDIQEQNAKKYEYFHKKTEDIFNDEFKGFEFNVNGSKIMFSPGDASEIKSVQSDINNFISKYLDDEGLISDAKGYHRALSAALNPDKLANHFYEKGKADAVNNVTRQSKNINMDVNSAPQQSTSSGFKVRALNTDSGNGLKIKSKNKN